jgi:hypothetical protein
VGRCPGEPLQELLLETLGPVPFQLGSRGEGEVRRHGEGGKELAGVGGTWGKAGPQAEESGCLQATSCRRGARVVACLLCPFEAELGAWTDVIQIPSSLHMGPVAVETSEACIPWVIGRGRMAPGSCQHQLLARRL